MSNDDAMDFEADCIRSALCETPFGARFDQLYAAQQALARVTDPKRFESPLDMIQRFAIGTVEGSEGCPSECDRVAS
jgi:hypothetical protein